MKKKSILKALVLALSISLFASVPMTSFAATNTSSANSAETQSLPDIRGESAITVDLETGEIIYCKDADSKRYPASTTKLLTGLLFAENKTKTDEIEFTKSAKEQPEYSLNINFMKNQMKIGDKMLAEDVMKGLLLFSGNDTAYMIADSVAGDSTAFADLMNKKAKELGANNSHFVTANGLHDPDHYTTAYDLSLITKAAFQNPWEKETMELKTSSINIDGKKFILDNRNLGLGKNGNIAGKTGTTNAAGGCLATVYERDGRQIIGIVLKSRQLDNADMSKFNDMDAIMDYSYNAQKQVYKSTGDEVGTTDLKYKSFIFFGPTKTLTVPLKLNQDVYYYKNDINDTDSKISFNGTESSAWKLVFNKDTNLTYSIRNYSESVKGIVDVSFGTILKDNLLVYISTIIILAIIVTLIFLIKTMITNSKKNKRMYNRKRRKRY